MNHDAASDVRRHGLFLDLDGTLADSLSAMRGVYDSFLQEFEATPSGEEFEELNGPPLAEIIKILKNRHGLTGSFDGLQEDYLAMVLDAYKNLPPSEGAPEVLSAAKERGWTIAVVTSSHRRNTWDWLHRNELSRFVDEVVGGDDVACGKPNPEPYLKALESTGCDVRSSLAVEDSRAGSASAVSAGLRTFVLARADDRMNWPSGVSFIVDLHELRRRLDHVEG